MEDAAFQLIYIQDIQYEIHFYHILKNIKIHHTVKNGLTITMRRQVLIYNETKFGCLHDNHCAVWVQKKFIRGVHSTYNKR